jgi:hypothetical protein
VVEFREPPPSGVELAWRLGGIRVRIAPSFFLVYGIIIALIAWNRMGNDPVALALAVALDLACIFVAILFVSYVQAIVYRSYGLRATIVVREFMSGVYPSASPPTALQRIAVNLAYPAGCFLLYILLRYTDDVYHWKQTSLLAAVMYLILTNIALFWAVIGLLPILPYAGGKVILEVFTLLSPRNGMAMALVVSIITGLAYIAYAVAVHFGYMREQVVFGQEIYASVIVAVFFVLSVMQNWQALQAIRAMRRGYQDPIDDYDDDRSPWER